MIPKEQSSNDRLSDEEEKILKQMEGFFDGDVKNMIAIGCNVSCATILGICIEVYGGIAEGTLCKIDKNGNFYGEKSRFEKFIGLMSEGYMKSEGYMSLNNKLSRQNNGKGLYEIFRSTLVHAYFFGSMDIKNDPHRPSSRCCPGTIGIRLSNEYPNRIEIHTNDLADDIKRTRDTHFENIRTGKGDARINFRAALDNIRKVP
jgi:hypothetical protein